VNMPSEPVQPVQTLHVGKWPEGLVVTDDATWVAESGERRVTRFGRDERAAARPAVDEDDTAVEVTESFTGD